MLKSLLLYLSRSKIIQNLFLKSRIAYKFALRFIAGETIDDAINAVKTLNTIGYYATIDYLGEQTNSEIDARNSTLEIIQLLERIYSSKVEANVSLKLSQLGLKLGEDFCKQNLLKILNKAKETENLIRIDMEDSSVTDQTLNILYWSKTIYPRIGIVIQSYLFRSKSDLSKVISERIPVRMVKGAYKESVKIAYKNKRDVDTNFLSLSRKIISTLKTNSLIEKGDGKFPPLLAIGTHDEKIIQILINEISNLDFPKKSLEIQMLYGIRPDLQIRYLEKGFPVRIYLPYGNQWFPYFMRRLAERPANLWFFLKNLFR